MNISRKSHLKNSKKALGKSGISAIERVIYAIKNLPDHLMEYDHEILLDFSCRDEEGQLIKAIREEYRIKAQWLEVYWLDRTELTFELTKTWKKHYKPFAERTNAFWKLAQEVHIWLTSASDIRTSPTISQLPTPLIWAFLCEYYLCEAELKNSGYTAFPDLVSNWRQHRQASNRA
ncbi:hypothetical protein [Chroococcidiopsis sp. CCMEE 29]|uniref:hypothetical protein n=1 Tax=Chroococcidiopsis sp. CCMEE 29 TaxID=155894 RepID=UPI0020203D9F|nr:hypothetical protein [Chroococcidiopsis sp. CCMEE 29]